MLPTIERALEKFKTQGKKSISIYEFRNEVMRTRIRREDMPYIINELKRNGKLNTSKGRVELRW